jgi:hypothetical protein
VDGDVEPRIAASDSACSAVHSWSPHEILRSPSLGAPYLSAASAHGGAKRWRMAAERAAAAAVANESPRPLRPRAKA